MWPNTVALVTSNALIIRHGLFHIFMKEEMNKLRHTSHVIDIFLFTVHSFFFFDEALRHTQHRRLREEAPNCSSYTFLRLRDCFSFFTFFSTLNGDFFCELLFTFIFFLLYSSTVWHNSFFYILANGTTDELFSLLNVFTLTWFATLKGFLFFRGENFHSFRAEQQNRKRKLFDSRVKLQLISTAVEVGLTCWALSSFGLFFLCLKHIDFHMCWRSQHSARERKCEVNELTFLPGIRRKKSFLTFKSVIFVIIVRDLKRFWMKTFSKVTEKLVELLLTIASTY